MKHSEIAGFARSRNAMSLLDRTDPNATRDSMIREAKIWAAVPAVLYPIVGVLRR